MFTLIIAEQCDRRCDNTIYVCNHTTFNKKDIVTFIEEKTFYNNKQTECLIFYLIYVGKNDLGL